MDRFFECPTCLPADFPGAKGEPFKGYSGQAMLSHIEAEHPWLLHEGLICGTCWRSVKSPACVHYNAYGQPL